MKNPFDFFNKKAQGEDTYLGLFLKETEGMLFYINRTADGNLKIIKKEKFIFSDGWEKLSEDVDEVLNRLETTTGKSPEKTVFFIYSHLVDQITKQIKRPYLHRIKQLVKNLELKPLGFIECHEAILDYFQQKEKIPLTTNLIEFDKTAMSIFVYTTGRLIFSETVPRTANVIEDLLPIFERIKTQTVIPPRIILYDSKDLDSESTRILTHQWGKDFFIQLPKVQIFKEDQVIDSFLNIFSGQMMGSKQVAMDIEERPSGPTKEEVMGFVIGDDVKEKPVQQTIVDATPPQTAKLKQPSSISGLIPLAFLAKFLANGKKTFSSLMSKTKSLPFPVLPIIGAILILGAFFSMEYFFHTAKVRVFFPSQELKKNLSIEAAVEGAAGSSDILSFKVATETADLSESDSATGKRSVGDKAKGTVAMLNYDRGGSKTFSKGTTIQAQSLKFVLADDVTVASSSVAPDLSLQPGKSNVAIVAEQIGSESNLAKGQKFQVGDSSQTLYLATNDNAFSGGSKKDIQTVSEEDIAGVKNKLLAKAKKYADDQLKAKLLKERRLLTQLTDFNLGKITYSKGAGDEAASVEGKSQAEITYSTYQQQEFLQILDQHLKKDVKAGFHINDQATNYKIKSIDQSGHHSLLDVDVQTKAIEDIKTDDLLSKMRGKKSDSLQDMVRNDYHAAGLDLEVSHPIPWLKNWLPLFKKNITLDISYL